MKCSPAIRTTTDIYIAADELELNAGTIQGVDEDVDAVLTYALLGQQNGHKVDGNQTSAISEPGAPTGLSATVMSQTVINLSWTAPTENGGSPLTGYRIEVSTDAGTRWIDAETDTGLTATTYEHTGLTPGQSHTYRVSAINIAGAGPPSGTVSAATSTLPNSGPMFTSDAVFTADENRDDVGTVQATDADVGDDVTYALTAGADMARLRDQRHQRCTELPQPALTTRTPTTPTRTTTIRRQ